MSKIAKGFDLLVAGVANWADPQFASIGLEVVDISPAEPSRETKEVTHHKSPRGVKEFLGGLIDPGECEITVQHDLNADLSALVPYLEEDKPRPWGIDFDAAGGVEKFNGILTNIGRSTPFGDVMKAKIKFKLSGVGGLLANE